MMRLIIMLLLGLTISACQQQEADTSLTAQAAFEAYIDALNTGDTEAAVAMYDTAPGFHWIERGGIQYESGADAAAALIALSASGGSSQMTIDSIRVAHLTEDSVLISAHFDFVMLSDTGEHQFSFDGWMTVGMVRRDEGWRIAGGQTGPGKAVPE